MYTILYNIGQCMHIYQLYTMQEEFIIYAIAMGPDGLSVANENQILKGSARELKW